MGNCVTPQHSVSRKSVHTRGGGKGRQFALNALNAALLLDHKYSDFPTVSVRPSRSSAKVASSTSPTQCKEPCDEETRCAKEAAEEEELAAVEQSEVLLPIVGEPSLEDEEENFSPSTPLIPGLPNAVSLQCLGRLTVRQQRSMLAVDRQWRELALSMDLVSVRAELGLLEEWLFLTRQEEPTAVNRVAGHTARLVFNLYDVKNGDWIDGPLPNSVALCCYGHKTAVVGGKFYLMTGSMELLGSPTNQLWQFDLQQYSWRQLASMGSSRLGFGVGVAGGKLYVVGGRNEELSDLDSLEVYEPHLNEWRQLEPMSQPRANIEVAALGGCLHVLERGQLVEVYDPIAGEWMPGSSSKWGPALCSEKSIFNVVNVGNDLFCIEKKSQFFQVLQFKWGKTTWEEVGGLLASAPTGDARLQPRLAVVGGKVLAVGSNFSVGYFHPSNPLGTPCRQMLDEAEVIPGRLLRMQRTELAGVAL